MQYNYLIYKRDVAIFCEYVIINVYMSKCAVFWTVI